jgi:transposase
LGLLLHALVTPADVQDRDGGLMLLATLFGQFPFLKKLFADSAYAGPVFHDGLANIMPNLVTEIVRRSDRAKGFVVLPKRWIVVLRCLAWVATISVWKHEIEFGCEQVNHGFEVAD